MPKRVAIVQSSYIPWKGYFDLIRQVDEFILYDDVQYTRRDWRSRNRIKTQNGLLWLTIPVVVKGRYFQTIKDTEIAESGWRRQHLRSIEAAYARAPHYRVYREWLESLYRDQTSRWLSEVNHRFISAICEVLGVGTRLTPSMAYTLAGGRTERLVDLCRQTGATEYLSGPSARSYIDTSAFAAAGIRLDYIDYGGYPEYPQLYPPFAHQVSILDLIFHTGPDALRYLQRHGAGGPVSEHGVAAR
jgi:hypothetical protein